MANDVEFNIIARDRASAQFSRVGNAAKESGGSLTKFAGLARNVFAAALIYEGAKKATEGLKGLAEAAAEDQTSAALMAKQFRNSAHATREQVKATEDWITKVGRAKGVADDDLRPALGNLVTATHNVRKAQRLTSLAMDIAAAKGKPLATVSLALSKAYNGNVGALGRLGIKTKDAKGKVLDFTAAQKMLHQQFGGAAATKAKTFTGVMDRFRVVTQETKESLGAHLLPVLTKFGNWFLSTGAPAIGRFASAVKDKLSPPLRAIRDFIVNRLIPAIASLVGPTRLAAKKVADAFEVTKGVIKDFVGALKGFFGETGRGAGVSTQFGKTLASVWTNLKSVVGSAISIIRSYIKGVGIEIGILVIAAKWFWGKFGDLITTYVVNTMKNMLKVVQGVFNVLAGLFKVVANVLRGNWKGAWDGIKQILEGALQIIKGSIGQFWNLAKTLFSAGVRGLITLVKHLPAALGALGGLLASNGRALVVGYFNGVKAAWSLVARFFGNVGSKIKSAIGNLGSLLFNAGKQVIQGLINGIGSMFGAVKGKLGELTGKLTSWKGPPARDKVLLTPAGRQIIQGLIDGFSQKRSAVHASLRRLTKIIADDLTSGMKKPSKAALASALKVAGSIAAGLRSGTEAGVTKALAALQDKIGVLPKKIRPVMRSLISEVTSQFATLTDRLGAAKSKLAELQSQFSDISSSIAQAFTPGDLFSGSMSELSSGLGKALVNVKSAMAAQSTLLAAGVSTALIGAVLAQGNGSLLSQLASDPTQARALGSQYSQLQTNASSLGNTQADAVLHTDLQSVTSEIQALRKEVKALAKDTGIAVAAALNGTAAKSSKKGGR